MDPSEMHDAAIRALDVLHALAISESEVLSASLRALDTLEAKALDEVKSNLDSRKDDDHHQFQLESSRTFRLLEQVRCTNYISLRTPFFPQRSLN
jgi:hypothetical protein